MAKKGLKKRDKYTGSDTEGGITSSYEMSDGVKLKVREGAAAASPAASVEGAKVPLEYTQEVEGLVNKYGGVILNDG